MPVYIRILIAIQSLTQFYVRVKIELRRGCITSGVSFSRVQSADFDCTDLSWLASKYQRATLLSRDIFFMRPI